MSNDTDKNFADRLRKSRQIRGLKQADLARNSGIPPSAISHFEAGERKPSFETLRRLAEALGVTIDFLLGRIDETEGLADADPLYRGFQAMNDEDRKLTQDFMEMLRNRHPGTQNDGNE
ncbi:MAG: helix-turn-helix transcriptional regulator [Gammaproteobacteria bacterium]|nr:helix-turn-helix transcriptional regulator [Gammaproteobacteria bacterium]